MKRTGKFTSSNISKLMSKGRGPFSLENTGKPFDTYIQEKVWEAKLGRELDTEITARSTSWGNLMELFFFEKHLDLRWSEVHKKRYEHPALPWSGAPDMVSENEVGDVKSPYTLRSFCELSDIAQKPIGAMEELKSVKPDYYWQLVSNAILTGINDVSLYIHGVESDYYNDLIDFSESMIDNLNSYAWISFSQPEQLPLIPKNSDYPPISNISFTVPEEDKKMLTARVEMATEILNSKLKLEQ